MFHHWDRLIDLTFEVVIPLVGHIELLRTARVAESVPSMQNQTWFKWTERTTSDFLAPSQRTLLPALSHEPRPPGLRSD